jgi:hypothetical protein
VSKLEKKGALAYIVVLWPTWRASRRGILLVIVAAAATTKAVNALLLSVRH